VETELVYGQSRQATKKYFHLMHEILHLHCLHCLILFVNMMDCFFLISGCECNNVKCFTILLLLDILNLLLCILQMYQTEWHLLHLITSQPFSSSCFVTLISMTEDSLEQILHFISFG